MTGRGKRAGADRKYTMVDESGHPRVYSIEGVAPVIAPDAFVHPDAVLIGDVIVGAGCYVGPGASLRGDMGRIVVEPGSNVQDNCVIHGFPGGETLIATDGHIAHGAVIHGCTLRGNVLVGMNAVVMDDAEIGESSIVAAMALVTAGTKVPPRSLVAGIPGRVVRELGARDLEWKRAATAEYQQLARRCRESLRRAAPLDAPEPDRGTVKPHGAAPLHRTRT